ncbi:hypothetical protein [Vibrio phage phiKT1024]|nr:hypothetical protein [Vibrio phage phiKT1024]
MSLRLDEFPVGTEVYRWGSRTKRPVRYVRINAEDFKTFEVNEYPKMVTLYGRDFETLSSTPEGCMVEHARSVLNAAKISEEKNRKRHQSSLNTLKKAQEKYDEVISKYSEFAF